MLISSGRCTDFPQFHFSGVLRERLSVRAIPADFGVSAVTPDTTIEKNPCLIRLVALQSSSSRSSGSFGQSYGWQCHGVDGGPPLSRGFWPPDCTLFEETTQFLTLAFEPFSVPWANEFRHVFQSLSAAGSLRSFFATDQCFFLDRELVDAQLPMKLASLTIVKALCSSKTVFPQVPEGPHDTRMMSIVVAAGHTYGARFCVMLKVQAVMESGRPMRRSGGEKVQRPARSETKNAPIKKRKHLFKLEHVYSDYSRNPNRNLMGGSVLHAIKPIAVSHDRQRCREYARVSGELQFSLEQLVHLSLKADTAITIPCLCNVVKLTSPPLDRPFVPWSVVGRSAVFRLAWRTRCLLQGTPPNGCQASSVIGATWFLSSVGHPPPRWGDDRGVYVAALAVMTPRFWHSSDGQVEFSVRHRNCDRV
ncbi:unnamed protein product [Soboliphyme baturini]|uniref:Uncharacterized protein n=1 Tax=Soboliphyme baturini TaxID=241478 RepID=A0A183J1R5_9BILA|nr:unnamed protein product [Soboliphyme baturini]